MARKLKKSAYDKPIAAWMRDVRDWIRDWMKVNKRNATGGTSRDLKVTVKNGIASVSGPSNIQWTLTGRKAGGFPPLNNLIRWIKAKGILPPGLTLRSFAFIIGRKLAKRGTSPKTPKLRKQNLDLVIRQKGKKHLGQIATISARQAFELTTLSLVNDMPNAKLVK